MAGFAIFSLLLLAGSVQAAQMDENANPMDKVFQLMGELTAKIGKEGEAEEKALKEFFEWCDDAAGNVKNLITTATKKKEQLEGTISKASADIEEATTNIDTLAGQIATAEADLKAATTIREKEASDFATVESELVSGVDILGRAIGVLGASSASLLQKKVNSGDIKALLSTLDVALSHASIATADKSKLLAMVQDQAKDKDSDSDMDAELGAPAAANYENQSGGIIEILEEMKDKAEGELKDARSAESKAKHAYAMLKKGLEDQLAADNKGLAETKAELEDSSETKATSEGDLAETVEELKTANANFETTSSDCMTSAEDHELSTKARAEELKMIAEVKTILKESTGGATDRQYSLLQVAEHSKMQSGMELANSKIVGVVQKLAKAHHSEALAQLASKISAVTRYGTGSAEDIFAKIKGLIVDMIEKLQKEAAAEASAKGFCDEENAKTKAKHTELTADIEKLTAKIDEATAASAQLKEEAASLQAKLAELAKTTAEMDKARTDEKEAFTAAAADLEAGIAGVQTALEKLREYYGSAALIQDGKFDSLMQQPAKPAGHSKASGAGGSIIGILEVCESDFSKSLAQEESTEASAQEEYDKVTQENKILKATMEQDVKYKTKEAKGLDKSVAENTADKSKLLTELGAVNDYQAELNEQCIAKVSSYEEIKAKREEEIAGLKEALEVLETEAAFLQIKPRYLRQVAAH